MDSGNRSRKNNYASNENPPGRFFERSHTNHQTQCIMTGTYTSGKVESLGTRSVKWQEKGDLDIQMRLDQLGELKWSVRNLQIQGNFDQLLQSIENGTAYPGTMALTRMDTGRQLSEYKMTKETKSQDVKSHQGYKNTTTEMYRIKTQPTIDVVYRWVEGHQAERYGNG
jgi:hypothetical protein